MSRNTYLIVSGAVIGSFLALPAAAQQDETAEASRIAAQSSFEEIDTGLDGSISRTELRAAVGAENAEELFIDMDNNGDEEVSRAEWTSWRRERQAARAADSRRNQVEVGISGDTIEGRYLTDGGMVGLDRTSLGLGLFFSTDRHLIGQGQLMVPGLLQGMLPGFLSLSAGGKVHVAFLADPDDEVFDLAPGIEARLSLPFDTPMAIVGNVFYAPEIFTFGDADQVWDANVRFEVQFVQNITGFAGYRYIDYDREEGGDDEIVDSFQFGLRVAF